MTVETINNLIADEVAKGIEQFKRNYINTKFEKNKLYDYLGEDLIDTFKHHNAIIAGGTVTSLFNNKDINDIDVYFRDEDSLINFLSDVWSSSCWIVSNTNKATQFMYKKKDKEVNVQLIHFKYFNAAEDIFDTFDYTVCMGAYDFTTEEFILHPDFLKHNSQRILKFNSETAFPIVSLLRVQKYEKKGYVISKPEFIRIILTCMNLNINTYEELKDQLGGMYGINYDKLFEDIEDEEFDLQYAIDKIANISLSEDYFVKPAPVEFGGIDDIIDNIIKTPFQYIKKNDENYRIGSTGLLRKTKVITYGEQVDGSDYFNGLKIYKFVKKEDDVYRSFYKNKFIYKIGEEVKASREDYADGKLYFNYKDTIAQSTYKDRNNAVLIEATIDLDGFEYGEDGVITTNKAFITREVPISEWEEWNKPEHEIDDLTKFFD
ncbi:hypothetical protein BAOM_3003 [Peribacillus asahii]|uniref:Uncharacterized protein n=1 Tax=Peribacillus asahii TaxID=228899 RepID=A0A3Q9RNI0_9BACI|nr:hypothetical protein [Peribacillus asahii]AZV43612.1 hypothetical protein BAOM_3003 [Peribacillus asahii]